jgi:hypothetical protein
MAGKKRCFSTVRALRRLDPRLLCDVLGKYRAYLAARELELPAAPTAENLPYAAIKDACMVGDIEPELDDVLFYVSVLGNKDGWDKIQREAEYEKRKVDFSTEGLSCADLAMKAWLWDWPKNKELLERSYARAKIHARSSYVYYPPLPGHGKKFKMPTKEELDVFRQEIAEYFIGEELGKGSSVVVYEFDKEVWFLIRYPGQLERHPAIDDEGQDDSHSFKPAEYDAVVFHRKYCDLRLNTNRAKDHRHYRIVFGHLLFNSPNVFDPNEKIVWLEPLKGPCRGIFKCEDVKGLGAIAPVEVSFACQSEPGREVIWRAEQDCSLLDYGGKGDFLLPDDTHSVKYAKFRYRLKDRTKWDTVTVHTGKTLNYERDGDSAVLEEWLRRRKFIKDTLGLFKDA